MNNIVYAGKHALTWKVNRHAHSSWELVYCTSGEGIFSFDDKDIHYKQGEIVVIPPLVPHRNFSDDGFTNIHLNMTDCSFTFTEPTVLTDDENRFILNAFTAAYHHFSVNIPSSRMMLAPLGNLIHSYVIVYQNAPTLSRIVVEIERNITENYTDCNYELDTYLQSLHFSYDYLRKLFKKELGVTPHKYLMDKRLQTASELLCYGSCGGSNSIAEISQLCGFREPLYFSRMFKKKYGVAPSYYLDKQPEASPIRIPAEE